MASRKSCLSKVSVSGSVSLTSVALLKKGMLLEKLFWCVLEMKADVEVQVLGAFSDEISFVSTAKTFLCCDNQTYYTPTEVFIEAFSEGSIGCHLINLYFGEALKFCY